MVKKILAGLGLFLLFTMIVGVIVFISYKNWDYLSDHSTTISAMVGTILGLLATYVIFSLGTLKAGEVGMLSRLGKPIKNLQKGLFIALLGIYSVRKESGTRQQDELPADPQLIFRGDTPDIPPGKFPPIRLKCGPPDPTHTHLKDSPYNKEMVAETVPVVTWQIDDAILFFENIGSLEECRRILTDSVVGVLTEEIPKDTYARWQENLKDLNNQIKTEVEAAVGGMGIKIIQAYVKKFEYSHSLNSAVEKTSITEQEKLATITNAEAYKKKLELETDADADREKRMAEARGKRVAETLRGLAGNSQAAGEVLRAEALGGRDSSITTLVQGSNEDTKPVIPIGGK